MNLKININTLKTICLIFFITTNEIASNAQNKFSFQIDDRAIGIILVNDSIPCATGFVIGRSNWVVSSNHIEILSPGPKSYRSVGSNTNIKLKPIRYSGNSDIIIFEAEHSITDKFLKVDTSFKFETKKEIVYMGYDTRKSTTNDVKMVIHSAKIEAVGLIDTDKLSTKFIEFIGQGVPGYSGGPILNSKGEVIAIFAQSYYRKGLHHFSKEVLINRAFSIWPIAKLFIP